VLPVRRLEMVISYAPQRFDAGGNLMDETTKD
jgi:hypothetical protein